MLLAVSIMFSFSISVFCVQNLKSLEEIVKVLLSENDVVTLKVNIVAV